MSDARYFLTTNMNTARLSKGVLPGQGSVLNNFSLNQSRLREWARIEAMTDRDVFIELQNIVDGQGYSWHTINHWLQVQVDDRTLKDTSLFQIWNSLCDEKNKWENTDRQSFICPKHNRPCLLDLDTIPILVGLDR